MILNASILSGKDFEFIEEGHIIIEKGKVSEVKEGFVSDGLNYKNYLVMPSLINAHTHLGDSFAKEAVLGLDVNSAVGPKGRKWELYAKAKEKEIIQGIRDSAEYMLESGITSFVDFREHGEKGVNLLKEAVKDIPIKAIILGRDINPKKCDGLGLNVHELDQIPKERGRGNNKIIAIHAGEVGGEVTKALEYGPDIIVHFTKVSKEEIELAAKKNVSVVICPRSNAVLGVGIPPVREMLDTGINVALGTDNVMINSPNLWREMEFVSKVLHLSEPLTPKEILRMVTINAAKMLKLNSGSIEQGKEADLIFLDRNARNLRGETKDNILATLVHRCDSENVRKVIVDGNIVIDKRDIKTKTTK